MSYHNNPTVNDLVLSIINDGDGSMCGMTYKQRCAAADTGIGEFRAAARDYSEYRTKHFEQPKATRQEILDAATCLQEYYRRHNLESK
jgi:hypothetical protein